MKNWAKSSFSEPIKNGTLKHIEFYRPRERYQTSTDLFFTMSEIELNISIQWWIILTSMDG